MKANLFTRFIPAAIMILFLLGCSTFENPVTSPADDLGNLKPLPSTNQFQLVLNRDTGEVEMVQRTPNYDGTSYFLIYLTKYEWDPSKNLLYATVRLENIVDMVFYGTRFVFDNTGGRWLVNSDGYDYYKVTDPTPHKERMPFISYERDSYHRAMPGADTREFILYCPPGVTGVDFWIDVVHPWEREEPIVEEQFCRKTLAISAWAISAFCYDFQSHYDRSPRGGLNDLLVWADLTNVGGSDHVQMYDDGMHWDREEGDYIYGVSFIPNPTTDFGMITIYCEDSSGNVAENDVAFIRYYTLQEYKLETIEKGIWSELMGPYYNIIRDETSWENFWVLHKGGPVPPPYVDFTKDQVLVAIAGFAGGGQFIEINNAFLNTKNKLELHGDIWNGSKGCILPTMITNAYHIVKMPIDYHAIAPVLRSRLFYCDEQLDFSVVSEGIFSKIHDHRELIIEDQHAWQALWEEHSGTSEPPVIDFDNYTVAAMFIGDRQYEYTYVVVDRMMQYEAPSREIYYSEHFPGYGCELNPLDCQPFTIILFPKELYSSYQFFYRGVADDCI